MRQLVNSAKPQAEFIPWTAEECGNGKRAGRASSRFLGRHTGNLVIARFERPGRLSYGVDRNARA